MNFAHLVGQHHFENQWSAIAHYGAVWTPIILITAAVLFGLFLRSAAQRNSLATERKK